MCERDQEEHCERCNDSGWIAVRTSFPMAYVGPGPCPDYATGVCDATCDRCDRGYEHYRKKIAAAMQRDRPRETAITPVEPCPVCGFDPQRDEGCLARAERGYCPADRGETGISERGPYKPVEPDPNAPEFDEHVPF